MDGAAQTAAARAPAEPGKPTFRHIFANPEFRALWLAQLLSVAGDQLARVAITVLVYDRTRSPFWTALTYAVTLLPWLVGGLALSGLADRVSGVDGRMSVESPVGGPTIIAAELPCG